MSDAAGNVIGIRRRFPNGSKVSIKGGKTGLFAPAGLDGSSPLLVCEGPTDTAAALDLGFDAIGRPNCNSRIEMTAALARSRAIAIVSDNDGVGRAGSKRLAGILSLVCPSVRIIHPPEGIKDLRQWLRAGLNSESLRQIIEEARPIEIRIGFKD
jgi:DNA primase